jgi:hypothetical protein
MVGIAGGDEEEEEEEEEDGNVYEYRRTDLSVDEDARMGFVGLNTTDQAGSECPVMGRSGGEYMSVV